MSAVNVLGPSGRLGLLSFALSAWVEGSTQLRSAIFMVNADGQPALPLSIEHLHSNEWIANFLHWLTRSSRDLDHGEQTLIAGFDLASALTMLRLLKIKPLLPFLLTPILATVPLPRSLNAQSLQAVKWLRVAFTIFMATIVGEFNKVTVLHTLRLWRRHQALRRKLAMGKIVARGSSLSAPTEDEEETEEIECLICSGLGTDEVDPMTQSISSLSSATLEPSSHTDRQNQSNTHVESFGPLEGFCATAPRKHALHRDCCLRWVETYRQQHRRVFLEPVHVQLGESALTMQAWGRKEKGRISSFLQAAGFDHMSQSLIFPTGSPAEYAGTQSTLDDTSVTSRGPTSRTRSSTLTVIHTMGEAVVSSTMLGTLRTSSPSCPACRGPVNIIFAQEPVTSPARTSSSSPLVPGLTSTQRYHRTTKLMKWFMRGWWKECMASVTGRSLLVRLVAQYSFLLVLVSMIKATRRGRQKK